jgi:hypothetical protein
VELARERAQRKAIFCLATGVAPSEYEDLTGFEVAAFVDLVNARK